MIGFKKQKPLAVEQGIAKPQAALFCTIVLHDAYVSAINVVNDLAADFAGRMHGDAAVSKEILDQLKADPSKFADIAKEKSTDEADALVRHLLDRGKRDTDGVRHSAKVAWRALALLQREIEAEEAK